MSTTLQLRRGDTATVAATTGAVGELIVDTTTNQVYLQDGVTAGGHLVGAGGSGTVTSVTVDGTSGQLTSSGSPITSSGTITLGLATTAVTPGSYTSANLTVDAYGRITAASSGASAVAGSDTQVQYNNSGAFGASSNFTYDSSSNTLTVGTIKIAHDSYNEPFITTTEPTADLVIAPAFDVNTVTSFGTGAGVQIYGSQASTLTSDGGKIAIQSGAPMATSNRDGGNIDIDAAGGDGTGYNGSITLRVLGGATNGGALTLQNQASGLTLVMERSGDLTINGSAGSAGQVLTTLGPGSYPQWTDVGTVTSVDTAGTVSGLTLTGGPITSSGTITLGGSLSLTSSDITTGLGYTPYNSTNPAGYTTNTGTVTSVTVNGTTGRITSSGSPITSSGSITMDLATTAVTAGSYTNANITVDAYGRITAASNGSAGGVTSFNTRTGAVTLTSGDVTTALGFTPGTGNGTVTSVSVVTANGVSGTVATSTTTPAITLSLGAITPSSVAATGTVTGSNLSGTNTGDQTITLTGDVTGSGTGSFATTLANTAVTAGSYTSANITVDAKGRITAAANGWPTPATQASSVSTSTTINWASKDVTTLTLTGNTAITNSGAVNGQKLLLQLVQGGSGSYTVTFTSETKFGTSFTSITLSTTVGAMDMVGLVYSSVNSKYNIVSFAAGY